MLHTNTILSFSTQQGSTQGARVTANHLRLIPFQLRTQATGAAVSAFRAVRLGDGAVFDLLSRITPNQIGVFPSDQYDHIVYFGTLDMTTALDAGRYVLEIERSGETYYSARIDIRVFDPDLLGPCVPAKLTYWNDCAVAGIQYPDSPVPFRGVIYFTEPATDPEYIRIEQGQQDASGVFRPTWRRITKQRTIQTLMTEDMTDALSVVPLHMDARGGAEMQLYGTGYVPLTSLDMTPDWQKNTDPRLAVVDVVFEGEGASTSGCCGEDVTLCLRVPNTATAVLEELGANYANREYGDDEVYTVQDGEVYLIHTSYGYTQLERYDAASDTFIQLNTVHSQGEGVYVRYIEEDFGPGSHYFFFVGGAVGFQATPILHAPVELEPSRYRVRGIFIEGAVAKVYARIQGDRGTLVGTFPVEEYNSSDGVIVDVPQGTTDIFVRFYGLNCFLSATTDREVTPTPPPSLGIGTMAIGSTFTVS